MFQWYPKDFEMIIVEKGKFYFDVLESMYEYESKTKKIETDKTERISDENLLICFAK